MVWTRIRKIRAEIRLPARGAKRHDFRRDGRGARVLPLTHYSLALQHPHYTRVSHSTARTGSVWTPCCCGNHILDRVPECHQYRCEPCAHADYRLDASTPQLWRIITLVTACCDRHSSEYFIAHDREHHDDETKGEARNLQCDCEAASAHVV